MLIGRSRWCGALVAALAGVAALAPSAGAQKPSFRAVDLGSLGGDFVAASAVNEHGQVVGSSGTANGTSHAFSWTRAGGMVDLGSVGGGLSFAVAVNDRGQVVGNSALTAVRGEHAFSWTRAGGMVDLGTLGGSS